jgi:hypothetical protein
MAVWCTLATQAWRATEREMWIQICPRARTSSLLAVTHADALRDSDQERVADRVQREAAEHFAGFGLLSLVDDPVADSSGDTLASADRNGAFLTMLEGTLEQVQDRRLLSARRAVGQFLERLERHSDGPALPLRAAS